MSKLIAAASDIFGQITPPAAIAQYGELGSGRPALAGFISNVIVTITMVGGLWALFNIITAGFSLISSDGDTKKVGEVGKKISTTFLGLLIMVAAPLLAAIIGAFLFKDPMYFLKPSFKGPQDLGL